MPPSDTALKLSDFNPGQPLPSSLAVIPGNVSSVSPCEPGQPLTFTLTTKAHSDDTPGRTTLAPVHITFTTGSLVYSVSPPSTFSSVETNGRAIIPLETRFLQLQAAIRGRIGKEVAVLIEPEPTKASRLAFETRVATKRRQEGSPIFRIVVEMESGLALGRLGQGGTAETMYLYSREPPASWSRTQEDAVPPCGQGTFHQSTLPTSTTPSYISYLPPNMPSQYAPGYVLSSIHDRAPFTDLDASQQIAGPSREMKRRGGKDSGVSSPFFSEEDEFERHSRYKRARRTPLNSSGESNVQQSSSDRASSPGKGKEREKENVTRHDASWASPKRDRNAEWLKVQQRIVAEQERKEQQVGPPAPPALRPRTYEELEAWAQGPLPCAETTRGSFRYSTIGEIGGNDKVAVPGRPAPSSWYGIVAVEHIEVQFHRPGLDQRVNLKVVDPTRHNDTDFFNITLFSPEKLNWPTFPPGSIFMIRDAHPGRMPGGGRLQAKCPGKVKWTFAIYSKTMPSQWFYGEHGRDPRGEGFSDLERDYMRTLHEWYRVCHKKEPEAPFNALEHGGRAPAPQRRPVAVQVAYKEEAVTDAIFESLSPERPLPWTQAELTQRPQIQLSKAMFTRHKNVPISTIQDVLDYEVVPFRFRVQSAVNGIEPERFEQCIVKWCKTCGRSFDGTCCQGCGSDVDAEYRFRFWVKLQNDEEGDQAKHLGSILPAQVWQPYMGNVLPDLPTFADKPELTRADVAGLKSATADLLMGKKVNGARPGILIDWTIESFWMTDPDGNKHRMFRAFDMI